MTSRLGIVVAALLGAMGCVDTLEAPTTSQGPQGPQGKADTGWVAQDSFEVEGLLRGTVSHVAIGAFAELATNRALQEQLIDTQVKFGKVAMRDRGYHLNQLIQEIKTITVRTAGDVVTLDFEAVVDVVRAKDGDTTPTLAELDPRTFDLQLPLDPIVVYETAGAKCFAEDCEYPLDSRNYFYCFAPARAGCADALPLAPARLTLTKIYPISGPVYPEYDQLLTKLPEGGVGFKAALLPTAGDDEVHYTFTPIKDALEKALHLKGTLAKDKTYYRYTWKRNGVSLIIDLYDPAVLGNDATFVAAFHTALADYQFIFYGGHSQYGTRPLLSDKSWYAKTYQLVMMESCRSYAYYARQVLRAKATAQDPTGFALADVLSTGLPSTFGNIMTILPPLLSGLMDGIDAAHSGQDQNAPSWQTILSRMDAVTSSAMHGAAGVRTNAWQPRRK